MDSIPVISEPLAERMARRKDSACPVLWDLLDQVKDPEIPVLSLWDLGVLQDIVVADQTVLVTITPTYSGCPALREMQQDIDSVLIAAGYAKVEIATQLAPAWSTEMISEKGRQQLLDYGIAPPVSRRGQPICCPRCASPKTQLISQFGSTACKALYCCEHCAEPFDYFKCL